MRKGAFIILSESAALHQNFRSTRSWVRVVHRLEIPKCYPHDIFFYLFLSVGIDTAFGQRLDIFLTDGDDHGDPGSSGIIYWTG